MNILLTIIVIVATLQQTGMLTISFCKISYIFFILFQTVSLAVGLNCYFCIGSISGDCAKGEESAMVDIPCGRSTLHSHSAAFNETDVQLLQNSVENRYDDLKSACVRFIEPRTYNYNF